MSMISFKTPITPGVQRTLDGLLPAITATMTKDGLVRPGFIGFANDEPMCVVYIEDGAQPFELAATLRKKGFDPAILVTEANTIKQKAFDEPEALRAYMAEIDRVGVSNHPDRVECVCLTIWLGARTVTVFAPILRPAMARAELGPWELGIDTADQQTLLMGSETKIRH